MGSEMCIRDSRVEEVMFANRIMRPAYKYLGRGQEYLPLEQRA